MRRTTAGDLASVEQAIDGASLARAAAVVRALPVAEHVLAAAIDLVRATRPGSPEAAPWIGEWVRYGCGPRASQYLVLSAKAHAAIAGRPCVEVHDIMRAAPAVLRHRLVRSFAAEADAIDPDQIIARLVADRGQRKG